MYEKPLLRPAKLPLSFIPPMKPLLVAEAPDGDDWIHEIKYDGWRVQVIAGDEIRAFTKNGIDYTGQMKPIVEAVRSRGASWTILDGELIVQAENGRCDFHGLRSAMTNSPERLIFYAFALLVIDGLDIRAEPCLDRRHRLCNLVGDHDPHVPLQFSEHFNGNGPAIFQNAEAMGLEGIVSKKANSRYRSGETTNWLKIKTFTEEEYFIVGHERGVGPTTALLARETEAGLQYAGGAMLTLDDKSRDRFWRTAEELTVDKAPLKTGKRKGATWLRPKIRARVKHLRNEEYVRHGTVKELIW
jgi:bifunctional non-homologous end joining protein LigD